MSKLAAAIAEAQPRRNGTQCTMCSILDRLDDIDRKAVENMLRLDSGFYGTHIADLLTDNGHPIRDHAVQNHRRGRCGRGRAG